MKISQTIALVTGGTSGIGFAVAEGLAKRGSRVAFCGRSHDSVIATAAAWRAQGLDVLGVVCDMRDAHAIGQMVDRVRQTYGPVDILVNNAGLGYFAELGELTDEQIREIFDVNVIGVFRLTRSVLGEMVSRQSGAIVNIASLAGKNGVPRGTAYSASKHALLGFSRSLMLEVRQHHVRVIAVCPGSVETRFFDSSGMNLAHPERVLQPGDVADSVLTALELPERALLSEIDIRPTTP